MRSSISLLLLPALVAASTVGFAADKVNREDARSIRILAEANRAEVHAGKLALKKAQADPVKQFAQHMVDDHGKMLEEVQRLAQAKGVKIPAGVNEKHKAEAQKLQAASGQSFDKNYMNAMVKGHEAVLKHLQNISKSAKDADVKAAADKAMPDVKRHLEMAQQLAAGPSAAKR